VYYREMLWIAKATFSVSALRTAQRLGEYSRHYCGHCSAAQGFMFFAFAPVNIMSSDDQ